MCNSCNNESHQGCSGLTRDSIETSLSKRNWKCDKCDFNIRDAPSFHKQSTTEKAEPKCKSHKSTLRILQLNIDGINPKKHELSELLISQKIDIALIQETKLLPKSRTPNIQGYSAIRTDRPNAEYPGGGLISYISHDLNFKKIGSAFRNKVEAHSFSIQTQPKKWIDFTNIYIPPRVEEADLNWLPIGNRAMFVGDLNGHSRLWDDAQAEDNMGSKILDWILTNNMTCLNEGGSTHINRSTGGESAPDIAIGHNITDTKWCTIEDIGSDHLPIVIEINNTHTNIRNKPHRRSRWKTNGNWAEFQDEIEGKMPMEKCDSYNQHVHNFNKILIAAGKNHIGKTKPKSGKSWINPKVRAAIRKRNQLRKHVKEKREEWLEACRDARVIAEEAKEESWINFIGDLENDPDTTKVWRTIRSLSGTPDSIPPNEAIIHNGKTVTSDEKKADLFAKHYANVSRLKFDERERKKNAEFKRKINNQKTVEEECCNKFSLKELNAAIKKMKLKGAPGRDDIPPSFLKNLGPGATEELLSILNHSFQTASIPQIWRNANIIPLLKSGKAASQISSYRPISLTSCVVKVLERMISNRLYHLAETRGWLNTNQAGFRKMRCTEDQILRMTQHVSDGFQQRKRTVMVLLDYSKAFDRVWKEDLLTDMMDMGVPLQMVKWLHAFLSNRQAIVTYNSAHSRTVKLRQGLPQGAVLSPLLFLFYINGIVQTLDPSIESALFADDASIWVSDESLHKASAKLQTAVNAISEWSSRKKMELNVTKSEVTFFSTSSHEATWRPHISLNNSEIPYNKSPKFLGVHLDRTLSFQTHVLYVCNKVSSRNRILASLASKSWGWRKKNLRTVYRATQQSVINYAGPAWQPYLSKTQFNKLETAQNQSLRIITGQYSSTPVEALRLEAGVQSCSTISKQNTLIAYEKALRLPSDHPRNIAATDGNAIQHRLKTRSSWRKTAKEAEYNLPLASLPRELLPILLIKPWEGADSEECKWSVHPTLPNVSDTDQHSLPEVAIATIKNINAEITIYTDGSCSEGTTNGGAAAIITSGEPETPAVQEILKARGRLHTSSYEEEKAALHLAINWILTNSNRYQKIAICSDSQSLLQALQQETCDVGELIRKLHSLTCVTTIIWVPAHCDIPGNEIADREAKSACTMEETEPLPISYNSAKSLIKRCTQDAPPTHTRIRETYQSISQDKDAKSCHSRAEGALLAQLRTGHCLKLASYRHRLDEEQSPLCPRCDEEQEETLEHWLTKCPALNAERQATFGTCTVGLGALTYDPGGVLALARASLLL